MEWPSYSKLKPTSWALDSAQWQWIYTVEYCTINYLAQQNVAFKQPVAPLEWGRRGHGTPWNKLSKIFIDAYINFQLVEN